MSARKPIRGQFLTPEDRLLAAAGAHMLLAEALIMATQAGAVQTLPKIRTAIRSMAGAVRNAKRRVTATVELPNINKEPRS